jgi:hypothetical protein
MMHNGLRKRYLFCALALLLWGCDGKKSASTSTSSAPQTGGLPGQGAEATHGGALPIHGAGEGMSGGQLPAGHPALPPSHPPLGQGEAADPNGAALPPGAENFNPKAVPIDPSKILAGSIQLSPKLKDKVGPEDVLYLSIRQLQQGMPGQILAVDRFMAKDLPVHFNVDGHNAMVPGTQFVGKVIVSARIDKDGDAMTKNPGDIEGKVQTEIPNKRVVVTLDTVLQ